MPTKPDQGFVSQMLMFIEMDSHQILIDNASSSQLDSHAVYLFGISESRTHHHASRMLTMALRIPYNIIFACFHSSSPSHQGLSSRLWKTPISSLQLVVDTFGFPHIRLVQVTARVQKQHHSMLVAKLLLTGPQMAGILAAFLAWCQRNSCSDLSTYSFTFGLVASSFQGRLVTIGLLIIIPFMNLSLIGIVVKSICSCTRLQCKLQQYQMKHSFD